MSAVIWCGIVAVWIFVLIPTWVRRGDIHWHRGTAGQPIAAQGPAENHARADSQDRAGGSGRRLHLPGTRRKPRTSAELPVEVETMDQKVAQSPAEERVSAAAPVAPRVRVAAAPSSGRLGGAVRASFGTGPKGSGRKKPTIRVRRARRLVALATLAVVTLIVAIFAGGLFIAVNLVVDVALILYVRHLRRIAKERQAKAAREKRARAARQEWEKVSAQERASQLDGWRAPVAQPVAAEISYEPATEAYEVSYEPGYEQVEVDYEAYEGEYAEDESAAPDSIDLTAIEQPTLIDLTEAPTEELTTARAS